jgi:glutamate carboxypeptidase
MASALLETVENLLPWLLKGVETLVRVESPSDDPAGINAAADALIGLAAPLHPTVIRYPQTGYGDVLQLDFFRDGDTRKPILLLGHLDTVWPLGTLAAMPLEERGGRLYGPGTLDMKVGVVMALTALKALRQLGLERPATMLLNSDEEIGSPVSRPITERLALESEAVYVLEPPQVLAYKTARKGVGQFNLHVTGVASHAGVDFDRGHSAIRELARLIETVSNFTEPALKRTVNVGRITGGTRSNVVAAEAYAEVDVRIATMSDAATVEALFAGLKVADPHCTLTMTGGINRPPMERTPATVALFEEARRQAASLGIDLEEASTGGGSDGNFTSALGVPTLDGMGAVGEGAHASHENVVLEHLVPRTALLAAMVAGKSWA